MREQIFWEGSLDTTFLVPYDSMNRFGVLFGLFWPCFFNFGYNLAISLAPQQKMVVGGQWKQRWRGKKLPLLLLTNMWDACTKHHSSVSKWIFCRAWNCTKVASKIVWNYFFNWNVKSIDFDDLEIIAWILLPSFLRKSVYCAPGVPFDGTNLKWRIEAWIQLKKKKKRCFM